MKKLTVLCLVLLPLLSFSQFPVSEVKTPGVTTQQEYNYIVNGMLQDETSGRNIKEGYKLSDWKDHPPAGNFLVGKPEEYKAKWYLLFRNEESKPCAIVLRQERGYMNVSYLCIPATNSSKEIWSQALNNFRSLMNDNSGMSYSFSYFWGFVLYASYKETTP